MGGPTKAMETQVPGPVVPNCRETPGGAHGEYRDLKPPPLPEGYRYLYARLNAIAARHAVIARIKHLSCTDLEICALMCYPALR